MAAGARIKLLVPEEARREAGGRRRLLDHWPWIFFGLAFLLVTAHVAVSGLVLDKPNEFGDDHWRYWEFGRRLVTGESLYRDTCCFNYMPVTAMYWSPLALVPFGPSKLVTYLVAVGGLGLSLFLLARMVQPRCPGERWLPASLAALSVLLCLRYLLRDFGEAGYHVHLLTMLVGGIYLAMRGREIASAACFGLAIAVKMTPGLLVPFLLWKRQWRLSIYTIVATAMWIALPSVWMGPSRWWQDQRTWMKVGFDALLARHDDVLDGNNTRLQNQALRPAVLRYLAAYPPGHPMRVAHPADWSFLRLSETAASRVATGLGLALMALCAWRFRQRYSAPDSPAWVAESSTVLVLMPLLSPTTWLQHLVLLIPAMFCLLAEDRCREPLQRTAKTLLGLFVVLSLVLSRELVGKTGALLLLSYHVHTLCMLIVLGLMLWIRPLVRPTAQDEQAVTLSFPQALATQRRARAA